MATAVAFSETYAIDALLDKVRAYAPQADERLIRDAYNLASEAHAGQVRSSGEPYVTHVVAVAEILADLRLDPVTIAAALLHDVVEDTPVKLDTIQKRFGSEVAKLVDGVTKLSRIEWGDLESVEAESLRKMFLAMADDIRVVLIKLADRLHNMRTLDARPPAKQRETAAETLEIFAPLANRLGIGQVKWELEDLSFRYLEPETYQELRNRLTDRRPERERYVAKVKDILSEALKAEGIQADISGRPKHIYSIYKKMQRKGVDFDQIYDLYAVRVLVDTLRDCYAALGVVHTLWRPIPGEFDDYIATPKDNLYQSIHTAVIGPDGRPVEIQIRTWEMHRLAEYGVAAHWRYKEQIKGRDPLEAKIRWLRSLMEWRNELTDAQEFVDSMKSDVFTDQVYVFTPKGDIVALSAGATPIDFAYHIHTDVGHRCRGAKVNGKLVSLDTPLHTGDRVEIITTKAGGPSRDWLNPQLGFTQTPRAREKIRTWFRKQAREEAIAQGREVLDKELRRLGLKKVSYDEVAHLFKYDKLDDFLAAIGHAEFSAQTLAARIFEWAHSNEEKDGEAQEEDTLVGKPPAEWTPPPLPMGVTVSGVDNLLTRVANCCHPLPGDDVIGLITRGRGISVHRRNCPNIQRTSDPNRLVEIHWMGDAKQSYPVAIRIVAFDRPGLVRDISDIVASEDVNMTATSAVVDKSTNTALVQATLEISSANQLANILGKIDRLPNVREVRRQVG